MKICWDNLENLKVYKGEDGNTIFSKGGSRYIESEEPCIVCGEFFLKAKYPASKIKERVFCSYSCARRYMAVVNSKISIGQRFGRWVVIKRTDERKGNCVGFLCRCDCGTERVVDSTSLLRGSSQSCGCKISDLNKERSIDLTGYDAGAYKVISRYVQRASDGGVLWKCKCSCGNYFYASASHIARGGIISCGCSKYNSDGNGTVNNFYVVPYEDYKDSFSNIEEVSYEIDELHGIKALLVRCAYCGKFFKPSKVSVDRRLNYINGSSTTENRFYCSTNCKKACPIFGQILYPKGFKKATSREVQPELRQLVLARDNYECQICGKNQHEVELHCHHIEGVEQNPIESADIDNCITLCKEHHKFVHSQKGCTYYDYRCKK